MSRVIGTDYARYISSPEWRKKRQERLDFDNRHCTRCAGTEALEVHHRTYDRLGCERIEDLLTLCNACHALEHGRDPSLPPAVDAKFFRRRHVDGMILERGQQLLSDIERAHRALEALFETLFFDYADEEPRVIQIRNTLKAMIRDYPTLEEVA